MTYCVGLLLDAGLVMLSDTRTNAGVDNISVFGKTFVHETPGERALALLTAGNLAVTQAVWNRLQEGVKLDGQLLTLGSAENMFRAAQLVGAAVREVFATDGPGLRDHGLGFDVSILLGGQIGTAPPRLFLVYAAGNFIEATADTPFLQIGEHKYGKPILDRVLSPATPLADGVTLALISMDSTLRSNLTVGLPIDLTVIRRDALAVSLRRRITEEDAYFAFLRQRWSESLREAYQALPRPDWLD
ncbi:proteasome-type protease [Falsiroseomonas tokyonensis]|uniref:Proteasome-type protease n=1 Tax=Falsiroseomonas tokyonensis TaxID=430521 RepID=A0ABV7BRR3_9PROT|nr:proteasome-type protease [Falsiroseomonas tokyonensis]MBU8537716.1 proteasome-type protease [Falsiroseomonas tokyonensis]